MPTTTAIESAVRDALAGELPGVQWLQGDDRCDCLYQRIGEWRNPYLGQTHQIRLCCAWDAIAKAIPGVAQAVQTLQGYYDSNRVEPQPLREWDSDEMDMPLGLWYRQLAVKTGRSVADIRAEYRHRLSERPRKIATGAKTKEPNQAEARLAQLKRMEATGWNPDDVWAQFKLEDARAARGR